MTKGNNLSSYAVHCASSLKNRMFQKKSKFDPLDSTIKINIYNLTFWFCLAIINTFLFLTREVWEFGAESSSIIWESSVWNENSITFVQIKSNESNLRLQYFCFKCVCRTLLSSLFCAKQIYHDLQMAVTHNVPKCSS